MKTQPATALYEPNQRFDLLHASGVGRLLRWRWGRLVFQAPLALLALLMIYDGFTGPRLAPQNIATVAAWVHFRGLVILALLLVGNLFCMSCPFTLPRTLARRLSGRGRRWPRVLRHKWVAIGALVAMFWAYEVFDLWASPWLTAWLVIGYFVAAFVLEALFAESPFCKYVCPLGTFNFVASTVSPLQITSRDREVCRQCEGKECVNGSAQVLGCGTELFVPQVRSNLDCTFCLDCARACPYDNVALAPRRPLHEFTADVWPRRWDIAFLALVFAFSALGNAFGMVPPIYALEATLSRWLATDNEALILALILGLTMLALPAALGLSAAWLSRRLAKSAGSSGDAQGRAAGEWPLRVVFARFAPAVVPLGFAVWLAHYWFHFASGALTIIPVVQGFLIDHGVTVLGQQPNWSLGPLVPAEWLPPTMVFMVLAGLVASLVAAGRVAQAMAVDSPQARRATLPWLALFSVIALAAVVMLTLPMEMRGAPGFLP